MFPWKVRVYYEDTDAAGVVYYANYLKYAERARTEWLRSENIHQAELMANEGFGFVVSNVNAKYMAPARLDDELTIESTVTKLGRARITMQQMIRKQSEDLVRIEVDIACVDRHFSPARMPEAIHAAFARHLNLEE